MLVHHKTLEWHKTKTGQKLNQRTKQFVNYLIRMEITPNFTSSGTTASQKNGMRSMRSMRMRGMANRSNSNANAVWNVIELDDDDENDVGPTSMETKQSYPSASSMIQLTKPRPRGVTMVKKGNQLFPAKFNGPITPQNSVMRRTPSTSKYSYKMRNILQTDLNMGMTEKFSAMRIPATKQPRPVKGITTSVSATSSHRRKIRKTGSLHDAFSQDIQSLLQSLHSDEFVGTINPQYHARYISDESFKPSAI